MIEAAKSKIHQVRGNLKRAVNVLHLLQCVHVTVIHFYLVQYKVRAYIQMKSSKACKREIKSVMNTAGNVSHFVLSFSHSIFQNLREADWVQNGKQKKETRRRQC